MLAAGRSRRSVEPLEHFLATAPLSESTKRAYRFDLEPFVRWLERRGTALDDVDARVLAAYAAELGRDRRRLAPSTIGRSSRRSARSSATSSPARVPEARSHRGGSGGCR